MFQIFKRLRYTDRDNDTSVRYIDTDQYERFEQIESIVFDSTIIKEYVK
ncbi:5949_t:CDS:2 [Cetraspora pellucida]|uniref:5949_t:CDS:1 n=1 Tax=Cetraspora pellucida TaxID=1433469 RepID=A0A9N9BPZ9_9GLOM|nr:5949_t:CDS:2 [Cetraspora pellucida]